MNQRTLTARSKFGEGRPSPDQSGFPALIVAWSHAEPARVGQLLLILPGPPCIFGRGDSFLPGRTRLQLCRQRPGRMEPTGPLEAPCISREQLQLEILEPDVVRVENIGKCRMLHNGAPVESAVLRSGDVIELREQLVFLFQTRPLQLVAPDPSAPAFRHAFGEIDQCGLVGESPAMWELRREVWFASQQNSHVLILGASGSGKELVARAIHGLSRRASRPLVSRNAATIPESLIDAELFGTAKNYPNMGMPERRGIIGEADGSTLFLDEFGELPQSLQSHLLRVMDGGEYQRLGEATMRTAQFCLVAATNRPECDLKHDVLARFKRPLRVPDLNQRREDIPLLVRHLLKRIARESPGLVDCFTRSGEPRLSPRLVRFLLQRRYETHVRELEKLLWQAIADSSGDYLDLAEGLEPGRNAVRTPTARKESEEPARGALPPLPPRAIPGQWEPPVGRALPSEAGIGGASLPLFSPFPAGGRLDREAPGIPDLFPGTAPGRGLVGDALFLSIGVPGLAAGMTSPSAGIPDPLPETLPEPLLEPDSEAVPLYPGVSMKGNAPPAVAPKGADHSPRLEAVFNDYDRRLLRVLRQHQFQVNRCARSPGYSLGRASTYRHLMVLIFKALCASSWSRDAAARLLAGSEEYLPRVLARMETSLGNLRERLAREGEAVLRERLARQYRGNFEWVERVIGAIQEEKL